MTLNISTGVVPSQVSVDAQIQRSIDLDPLLTPAQVAVELAASYLEYSKEGTLPGADLTPGGTQSILNAGFISDNTTATITAIAEGICNYWTTNNAIGTPTHGGTSVQSVDINGAAVIPQMIAAIQSILTDVAGLGFEAFYTATEAIVKTIPCVITEIVDGSPVQFPETIT